MLLGLGTDAIEIARVKRADSRRCERFPNRVFTEEKPVYSLSLESPQKHLDPHVAAKEAILKACPTGIGAELRSTSMSFYNGSRHDPLVRLDDKGAALPRQVGGAQLLLSIAAGSDAGSAVLCREDPRRRPIGG